MIWFLIHELTSLCSPCAIFVCFSAFVSFVPIPFHTQFSFSLRRGQSHWWFPLPLTLSFFLYAHPLIPFFFLQIPLILASLLTLNRYQCHTGIKNVLYKGQNTWNERIHRWDHTGEIGNSSHGWGTRFFQLVASVLQSSFSVVGAESRTGLWLRGFRVAITLLRITEEQRRRAHGWQV